MPLMINTNVASLSAQNSMNKAQQSQQEAMERLTTGKRINTAADDAAGLSIANKMTSQVKGLNQAVRNANDGISLLQTAAGGLEESGNILQRMRELSVQSASGTYTSENRGSMQAEVEQLKAELDRISDTTTFNGQKILDGSQKDTKLQVGANANETISFDIKSTAANKLGGASADIVGEATGTATGDTLAALKAIAGGAYMEVNDQQVADLSGAANVEAALALANDSLNGVELGISLEMSAVKQGTGVIGVSEDVNFKMTFADGTTGEFEITDTSGMDEVVKQINDKSGGALTATLDDQNQLVITGENIAELEVTENGTTSLDSIGIATTSIQAASLTLTADQGTENIKVEYGAAANATATGIDERSEPGSVTGLAILTTTEMQSGALTINGVEIEATNGGAAFGSATAKAEALAADINKKANETGVTASVSGDALTLVSVDGSEPRLEAGVGYTAAQMVGHTGLQETNAFEGGSGTVGGINISSQDGAQRAIKVLDKAIEQVSEIQSDLGAVNNRLDFTVNNLSNVSENAAAARSRIEDADFASESANLSRAKVLQQAGQTMLAQANSAPQQVLSLLQ